MSGMGRWRWLLVPALVVPVGWVLFAGIGKDPREIPSPLVGRPLPAFSAPTLEGGSFTTDDLAGRPALINVWASWCAPCVEEHPLLLRAAADHAGALQLVGIVYQDSTDTALAFLARYGDGGWPDVLDGEGRIAVELGVTGPPETFFVDASGIVRYRHVGPLTTEVLDEQLAAIGLSR
jgi:cytochrome c biogenesis protein CcmG/thiol:disulfide interchange protein DsbE